MRPELCNGVDDDCDGQVDDSPRQPSCALTLGVCASKRPSTCGGASGWLACTASDYGATYEPTEATCGDGLDNDCDGQADAADADCAPWSHTVAIDGTNDFTAEEQFSTTSAGYTGWVTWDADDLFVGYEGADVASGTATKWLVVYLGATGGGTTAGEQFNHQRPILPFTATHLVMIRMDFGYFSLRDHDVSWVEATPAGAAVAHAGTFVEFRIPRASLGAPAALSVHLCMLNEQFPGEWTWGGVPSSSFVDRFDPDFLHYLQFDLTAQAAPGSSLPQ
jgi:hypothetical protein